MKLEYTSLTSSNRKYVATFDYSAVSSTPKFGLLIFDRDPRTAIWPSIPSVTEHAEGAAAIKAIRRCVEQCQAYTTLLDKDLSI
jgi:hypothetical protein